jgi:uncharacterized membrane protein HdeD (DUF308 family)
VIGVGSLTLVLGCLFLVEGIFDIALFFHVRSFHGAAWILFDGIISLVLGLLIYLQWPSSSAWAIGTLVGVSVIISGVTRLKVSLAGTQGHRFGTSSRRLNSRGESVGDRRERRAFG